MKRDLRCAGRTLQKNRRVARGLSSHLRKNHRREFSLGIDLPNPGRHLTGRVGRHRNTCTWRKPTSGNQRHFAIRSSKQSLQRTTGIFASDRKGHYRGQSLGLLIVGDKREALRLTLGKLQRNIDGGIVARLGRAICRSLPRTRKPSLSIQCDAASHRPNRSIQRPRHQRVVLILRQVRCRELVYDHRSLLALLEALFFEDELRRRGCRGPIPSMLLPNQLAGHFQRFLLVCHAALRSRSLCSRETRAEYSQQEISAYH